MGFQFWHNFRNPRDIYETLKVGFIFTGVIGLTPIWIYRSKDRSNASISKIFYASCIVNTCVFLGSFLVAIVREESVVEYFFHSNISRFGSFLQKCQGMWGIVATFVVSLTKTPLLLDALRQLDTIDRKLIDLGVIMNYRYSAKRAMLSLIWISLISILYTIGGVILLLRIGISPSFFALMSFYPQHWYLGLIVWLFSAFTITIRIRFDSLNKILTNLSGLSASKRNISLMNKTKHGCFSQRFFTIYRIAAKSKESTLEDCMTLYTLLHDLSSDIHLYFSYQIAAVVGVSFGTVVFDGYYMLIAILGVAGNSTQLDMAEFIAFFAIQVAFYLLAVLAIVESAVSAVHESKKTAIVVHKLINQKDLEDIRAQLLIFSMQLVHEKIVFTATGLFEIDRTLYYNIAGSVTTYLIILLQFTTSGSSDETSSPSPLMSNN